MATRNRERTKAATRARTLASLPYASTLSFLVSQVGARSAQRFAEELAAIGVQPREFAVLANIDASAMSLNQQAVADALEIHRNSVVTLVDALEERGWVSRERDSNDRRSFQLVLTSEGRRKLSRAMRLVAKIEAELTAALGPNDAQTLQELLARLADGVGLRAGVHPHLASRPWRDG